MKGILFLCVANSARSQMAEGLAGSIVQDGTVVWSAGSRPTALRPEAVEVMAEIGVDISGYHAKPISDVPLADIDTVVTLCADEVCPILPGNVTRLHWGLADPAAVEGNREARLDAFRVTRDELRRLIAGLVGREGRFDQEDVP